MGVGVAVLTWAGTSAYGTTCTTTRERRQARAMDELRAQLRMSSLDMARRASTAAIEPLTRGNDPSFRLPATERLESPCRAFQGVLVSISGLWRSDVSL